MKDRMLGAMIPEVIAGCGSRRVRARLIVSVPWLGILPWLAFAAMWVLCQGRGWAADRAQVEGWLGKGILPPDLPLQQVQAFTERQVPVLGSFDSREKWEDYAKNLRKELLDEVVFRGAAAWRTGGTKVEWFDPIAGGPGYRIRKLRYEALPGLWIPGLLYEPEKMEGKVPVVLNLNGHERLGKAADYKQLRCINQAKRGMLALNPEWLGMGQLSGANYQHGRMNQLDLCGISGLAPYYLVMKRALDVLLGHRQADPTRVGVAGLSGGGWQTIVVSALDERVTLSNPVAGYSSFRTRARHLEDLGDSEQTPNDLAVLADYTHLTALLAPRPALLTYNAKDNCCFAAGHALPPLMEAAQRIYRLYDQESRLRSHINLEPGDHNFGLDNRQALYRMLGEFFHPNEPDFRVTEIPSESELKSPKDLEVPLPDDNADFHSLALAVSRDLPRQAQLPSTRSEAETWQRANREVLAELTRARPYRVTAQRDSTIEEGGLKAHFWRFQIRTDWTLPGVELVPASPEGTVILIHDQGRSRATDAAMALLQGRRRVVVVDLFNMGESRVRERGDLFLLLVAAVGERPLGLQAAQLGALARWARRQYPKGPLSIHACGPGSSLTALVAAALEEESIQALELEESFGSLREVIERNWTVNERPEMFCFGLLERFDMRQLTALVAPRPVVFGGAGEGVRRELAGMSAWYSLLGREHEPLSQATPRQKAD